MCIAHRRRFLARSLGLGAVGLLIAADPSLASPAQTPAPSPGQKWICPPCGCASDGKDFDAAGECPSCGMLLIVKPAPAAPAQASEPTPSRS